MREKNGTKNTIGKNGGIDILLCGIISTFCLDLWYNREQSLKSR
jgi:hypothetical protein